MKTAYINARIYNTAKKCFEDGTLYSSDGIITDTCSVDETVDLGGARIIPGMVDVHTHGRMGMRWDDADAETAEKLARAYAKAGTTSVMATFGSTALERYQGSIDGIASAKPCGANILGVHFEGRYLSLKKKGAHAPDKLAPLDSDELARFITRLTDANASMHFHLTTAPELDGAEEFIKRAISLGATVGIGHSDASYEQCLEAMKWGAVSFTHLYNAMSAMTHRAPGCVGAALSTDAYTELICDGYHIDPAVVRVTQRAKSSDRLTLITDSSAASGMPRGIYKAGDGVCDTRNGKIGLCADGVTINGSIIDLFTGMKNFMSFTGITLEEAIPYATVNPARMVGADGTVGSLEVGRYADFIVLGDEQDIVDVYVRGEKQ